MSLVSLQPQVHGGFRELPRPSTDKPPQCVPELDSLRSLLGARGILVFTGPAVRRPRFLAASPSDLVSDLPPVLMESDYHFVERAGCVFAFEASGLTWPLDDPSTLCRIPDGRLAEALMSQVLGRLILRDESSVVRQVSDDDSACWALSSPVSLALIEQAEAVARSPRPVIILGETGVGKELMARFIHQMSGRDKFVATSMAQVRGESAISELFGHVKGAFTGASARRLGAFLEAGEGTLFLDEIAEMPDQGAALLLRAIEEKKIKPLGSDKEFPAPARILAATNRPDYLRKELLYRFVHRIVITPLRERPLDIRSIARFIAFREGFDLSEKALRALETISAWDGNVRELECFLVQAGASANKPLLGIDDIMNTFGNAFSVEHGLDRNCSSIQDIRKNLGLSIRELATVLGLPKSTLNDIEKSGVPEKERELLIQIGDKLDLLRPKRRARGKAVSHELKRFIAEE